MTKLNFFKKLNNIINKKGIERIDEFEDENLSIIRLENKSKSNFLRIRVQFNGNDVQKFYFNYNEVAPTKGLKWIEEDVLLD